MSEEENYDVIDLATPGGDSKYDGGQRNPIAWLSSLPPMVFNWTAFNTDDSCISPCPFYVQYRTSIYGFVCPPVILFTVITNSLICAVLLRRNMRTATNALLLAMALSDMLTGLWPLPCYVYFYTLAGYRDWVPHRWCVVYSALTDHLPTVFHTASIWLTVALALHRYVCVCKPQVRMSEIWVCISLPFGSIVEIACSDDDGDGDDVTWFTRLP